MVKEKEMVQEKNTRTQEVHTRDKDKGFIRGYTPTETLKEYYNMELGDAILVQANIINSFLRAMESVGETNFMVLPINKEMRKLIYPAMGINDFGYIIIKVPNSAMFRIDSVLFS